MRSSALSEDSAQASFAGEFETVLDVKTPLTWSLLQVYIAESLPFAIPGGHPYMGSVGGRFYLNVSFGAAFFCGLQFKPRAAELRVRRLQLGTLWRSNNFRVRLT